MIIGPDGQPVGSVPASALAGGEGDGDEGDEGERAITDLVEQPAKVMRIGSMIRQLLEEVKSAPLDEASRNRLREIHQASIDELEQGLAPELVEELQPADAAVLRRRHPLRRRAADRPGPAGRLARGPLPRHPDGDLRPADGGQGPVRADPEGAAGRDAARRASRSAGSAGRTGSAVGGEAAEQRHVPLAESAQVRLQPRVGARRALSRLGRSESGGAPSRAQGRGRARRRTTASPSSPMSTRARPGAATRVSDVGSSALTGVERRRSAAPVAPARGRRRAGARPG